MQGKTHMVTGSALGAVAAAQGIIEPTMFNAVVVIVASVLPDIDKRRSTASKKVILPIHLFFKHRGFTHSLVGGFIFLLLLSMFLKNMWVPFIVGFMAHIIPDMLTTHGIKLFWPMKVTVRFPFTCATGSIEEWMFSVMMAVVLLVNLGDALGL